MNESLLEINVIVLIVDGDLAVHGKMYQAWQPRGLPLHFEPGLH
jgi:hypothetical protein